MSVPISAALAAPSPFLVQNYGKQAVRFVRGQGVWLLDETGSAYLDGLAGIAVNSLGHAHPALVAAIQAQAATLIHTSNLYHIGPQERLAHSLCAATGLSRAFFCNSGTEANEAAIKIARLYGNVQHGGRKTRIIACEGGFHGRTLGALALTHTPAYREPFAPLAAVTWVPYGNAEALAAAMDQDVAAVVVEPLKGEGGVVVPPPGWLAALRTLCDQHGALLCLDEVQSGVGRCGAFLACQLEGVRPDVVSLAKGLGGGMPIGACLMTEACAALMKPGTHGTTFGGNFLACAAAQVVVDTVCAPGFMQQVLARGEQLRAGLSRLFPACEVRGRGLLCGVALKQPVAELITRALEQGLVVGSAAGNVLRLAPPLIISQTEVGELLARLERAR